MANISSQDGESGTWSPTHNNDKSNSQSPAAADNTKSPGGATSPSTSHRNVARMPLAGSPVAPAEHTVYESSSSSSASLRPRKLSNATVSSSLPSSLTAPPQTTTQPSYQGGNPPRPARNPSTEADPAAVMKRKKAAHNAIEKRYRTNMNAKFLALGNSIPRPGPFATQLASNKGSRKHSLCAPRGDSAQQQQQQQQQNKSEILTNALSYIQELQEENSRLKGELMVLKENLLPRGNIMWRR